MRILKFFFEKSFSLFILDVFILIIVFDHVLWRATLGFIMAVVIDYLVRDYIARIERREVIARLTKLVAEKLDRIEKEGK